MPKLHRTHGCRSVSLCWRIPFTNVWEWSLILHQSFSSKNDPSLKICGGRVKTNDLRTVQHAPKGTVYNVFGVHCPPLRLPMSSFTNNFSAPTPITVRLRWGPPAHHWAAGKVTTFPWPGNRASEGWRPSPVWLNGPGPAGHTSKPLTPEFKVRGHLLTSKVRSVTQKWLKCDLADNFASNQARAAI